MLFIKDTSLKNLQLKKMRFSFVLTYYLLKLFLPVFFVALLFFILILELGDTFYNLSKFIENNSSLGLMVKVMALYLPKCVSYAMPIAMLFASSYTLGSLYSKKELTVVFSSGISLQRFIIPILIFAFLCSVGMYYFEDRIVIPTFAQKNEIIDNIGVTEKKLDAYNIAVMSDMGTTIYIADRYDDTAKTLYNVKIIHKNETGVFDIVIICNKATWDETNNHWLLSEITSYSIDDNNNVTISSRNRNFDFLTEPPQSFQNIIVNIDNMKATEAKRFLQDLERKGISQSEYTVKYYQRFSFPFTIFIVLCLSITFGGYLKKNVLLMSLLLSLSFAVLYYVTQMLMTVFASWGMISPIIAAWFPFVFYFMVSLWLMSKSRT